MSCSPLRPQRVDLNEFLIDGMTMYISCFVYVDTFLWVFKYDGFPVMYLDNSGEVNFAEV